MINKSSRSKLAQMENQSYFDAALVQSQCKLKSYYLRPTLQHSRLMSSSLIIMMILPYLSITSGVSLNSQLIQHIHYFAIYSNNPLLLNRRALIHVLISCLFYNVYVCFHPDTERVMEGLLVLDGAIVPRAVGVNPALSDDINSSRALHSTSGEKRRLANQLGPFQTATIAMTPQ